MPTTSRRSWLSAVLFALIAPWWPRAAAARPAPVEQGFRSYTYDRINGLVPVEEQYEVIYTYDRFNRLTRVQHVGSSS